jgi:hypothetical protein
MLDGRLWFGGAASKISMAVGIGTKTSCGSYVEKSITPGCSSFEFLAARHDVTKKRQTDLFTTAPKKKRLFDIIAIVTLQRVISESC